MNRDALRRAWSPLRQPLFRALWLAAIASNIGTWMHSVGAAWLMTTMSATPLMTALVQTATFLPTFLFGLLGGVFADIIDRRHVLLFTQTWMLVVATTLGFLTLFGAMNPWWLLALTFALGTGQALNGPSWQTAMPELAPKEELPAVVALNGVQFNIARAVGPALGGLIMAATNAGVVFLLNALSFLAVIAVLWRWKRPPHHPAHDPGSLGSALKIGLQFVRRSAAYHALLARTCLYGFSFTALWALLPVAARMRLHGDATTFGVLLGCVGLGAVIGAAVHASLRAKSSVEGQAAVATLIGAVGIGGLGLTTNYAVAAGCMLLAGISWMIAMSVFNVRAQLAAPPHLRARGLAVYMLTHQGAMAAGAGWWGFLADRWSVENALVTAAVALAAGLIIASRLHLSGPDDESLASPIELASVSR